MPAGGISHEGFAGSTGAKKPLSTKGASPKRCLEDGSFLGEGAMSVGIIV